MTPTAIIHPPPAAVSFDVGGTLIEPWPSVGHVYAEVAAGHGVAGAQPVALNRAFAAVWRARGPGDYSRGAWRTLVDETFAGAGAARPSEECFAALYRRFTSAEVWRVFEDVHPTLAALRARGLKLGVISNWDDRLRPLLEALGLAHYFQAIAVSREVGHAKPAKEIFDHAAASLGVPLAALLHVGDSVEEDVAGAIRAGARGILLDRQSGAADSGRIPTLTALAALLAKPVA